MDPENKKKNCHVCMCPGRRGSKPAQPNGGGGGGVLAGSKGGLEMIIIIYYSQNKLVKQMEHGRASD